VERQFRFDLFNDITAVSYWSYSRRATEPCSQHYAKSTVNMQWNFTMTCLPAPHLCPRYPWKWR